MEKIFRFVVIPIALISIVFMYYHYYTENTKRTTPDTVAFIQKHINSQGKLVDYYNEIGVKSVDDIKLFVTGKQIKIVFGELALTWKPEDFVSEENQKLLAKIGITLYEDEETGKLRVFYQQEEITRWVS